MNFSFKNVYTLKLKIIDDRIINIHNVYNSSFIFYTFKIVLIALKIMKNKFINEKKTHFVKRFQSSSFDVKKNI
jgi:hypothetical protein